MKDDRSQRKLRRSRHCFVVADRIADAAGVEQRKLVPTANQRRRRKRLVPAFLQVLAQRKQRGRTDGLQLPSRSFVLVERKERRRMAGGTSLFEEVHAFLWTT